MVATALTRVFVRALYAAWFRVRRDEPVPAHAAMPLAVTPLHASEELRA